jgi:hypothetical protein
MSLQTSRFESQQIVNNFNLFVDSEKSSLLGHGSNRGDQVSVHFEGNSVEAADGEIIRLSLTNFTMFNNIYNVNINNSKFRVRSNGSSAARNTLLLLSHKNYKDIAELASDFASQLEAELEATAAANGGNSNASVTINSPTEDTDNLGVGLNTSNRLLDVTFTFAGAHGITNVVIQNNENDGDSYALLGGKRLDNDSGDANTTFASLKVTLASTTVRVQGFFPMQRLTDPYVYLRCGAVNNGLEMSALSTPVAADALNTDVINSDILAKVFKGPELISFHSSTDEYFINLQQRRLSTLKLFLTDKNGRPLGRLFGSQNGTAAGLEDSGGVFESQEQSTLGNLFFTAVIKVEIIKVRNPKKLESDPPAKPLPARLGQAPYVVQDFGNPRY